MKSKKWILQGLQVSALLIALSLSLASLGPVDDGERAHSSSGDSWTVLVYMVADNNLEQAGLGDIYEMAQVGSTDKLNIIAQVDRAVGYSDLGIADEGDWEGTRRIKINAGQVEFLQDLGELNMGDPNNLKEYINWGVQNYPADRYALVLWDHGASWPGFGGDESTPSMDMLDLNELRQGIEQGLSQAKLDEFALIGFDACLMGSVEVALALEPYAEYLLSSEEIEPGHGWDYQSLALLRDDPTSDPVALGRALANGFDSQALQAGDHSTITLSLIDLYALAPLREAVEGIAAQLKTTAGTAPSEIAMAYQQALRFAETSDRNYGFHMVDVGDLLVQLADRQSVFVDLQSQIADALQQAVVLSVKGEVAQAASGLSIYLPLRQADYKQSYEQVPNMESWRGFLHSMYGSSASSTVPTFSNANHVADFMQDAQSDLHISGQLTPGSAASIVDARLYVGLAFDDATVITSDRVASFDDSSVSAVWGMEVMGLIQGQASSYVYSSLNVAQNGQLVVTVPFFYQVGSEGDYVEMRLVFDGNNVVQQALYSYTESGPGELSPAAGSRLWPLLLQMDAQGNVEFVRAGETSFDANGSLSLASSFIPAGNTLYCSLQISNSEGQGDFVDILLDI